MFNELISYFYKHLELNSKLGKPTAKKQSPIDIEDVEDIASFEDINDIIDSLKGEDKDMKIKHVVLDLNNINNTNIEDVPDEIKEVINILKNLQDSGKLDGLSNEEVDEIISQKMDTILGQPNEKDNINISGRTISRRVYKQKPVNELEALQKDLKLALEDENYERAGILRDKIANIKSQDDKINLTENKAVKPKKKK